MSDVTSSITGYFISWYLAATNKLTAAINVVIYSLITPLHD